MYEKNVVKATEFLVEEIFWWKKHPERHIHTTLTNIFQWSHIASNRLIDLIMANTFSRINNFRTITSMQACGEKERKRQTSSKISDWLVFWSNTLQHSKLRFASFVYQFR